MQSCGFCYITHSTYTGHEVDWRKDKKKQSASTNQVDDVRETQVIDGNIAWDGQEVKTVLDALPDVLPHLFTPYKLHSLGCQIDKEDFYFLFYLHCEDFDIHSEKLVEYIYKRKAYGWSRPNKYRESNTKSQVGLHNSQPDVYMIQSWSQSSTHGK